jgi:hypothetical protein
MSSVPVLPETVPPDAIPPRLTDLPIDEIAFHVLDLMLSKKVDNRLRDCLTDLGNALSPHELAQVYEVLEAMTSEDGLAQVRGIAPMWSQLRNGAGAVYTREVLFDGTTLFRSDVKGPNRAALVCFTSRQDGMFMPNVRFLQLLGEYPIDVVLNSTESGTFGLWNLGGTGSFAGSLSMLKTALAERGIRTRAYAGASAGCGPAVYAATLDAGTSAVLFGCRFFMPGRNIPLADAGPAFEPICACWQGVMPRVYNIFGALQGIDIVDDARLRHLVPGTRSYPLPNDDKHSPLSTLTARRKLRPVMERLVEVARGRTVSFDMVVRP